MTIASVQHYFALIIISALVTDAKPFRSVFRDDDSDGLVMVPYHGEDAPPYYVSN